ncbi:MAG: prepilin-type N-terminal cleavage/methylation domain-containing protein [Kiritimatiellae bacterium]|nr:prepilin-type N-terminal cleavage/methylation domain-containing protein [Kiritimatiellia bacterium]MDD4734492.1 prepilin-type N-terminal cleavage/methylation domain-containing protein [Kiritimatiellia bacterium]
MIKNSRTIHQGSDGKGAKAAPSSGFTLIEIIIAMALFFGFIGVITSTYLNTLKGTHSGLAQMNYTTQARLSGQKIARYIESCKFFNCVSSTELSLFSPNPVSGVLEQSRLRYIQSGSDVSTYQICHEKLNTYGCVTETNRLASYVTAISNQPIFSKRSKVVYVSYHIGDPAGSELATGSGPGYQGQEVRFYVTPRNVQTWFD